MYDLEFQPVAQQDMINIVAYISKTLSNPMAAGQLAEEFIIEAENIRNFPYSMPVYNSPRSLKYEYRKLPIKNYIMFYRVDESKKLITVARVIYAKSDYRKKLEQTI